MLFMSTNHDMITDGKPQKWRQVQTQPNVRLTEGETQSVEAFAEPALAAGSDVVSIQEIVEQKDQFSAEQEEPVLEIVDLDKQSQESQESSQDSQQGTEEEEVSLEEAKVPEQTEELIDQIDKALEESEVEEDVKVFGEKEQVGQ